MRIDLEAKAPVADPQPNARRAKDAALQFEALVLGQILKSAQPNGFTGEEGESAVSDFAAQQLSQALASSGGIGLSRLLAPTLASTSDNRTAAPTSVGVGKL